MRRKQSGIIGRVFGTFFALVLVLGLLGAGLHFSGLVSIADNDEVAALTERVEYYQNQLVELDAQKQELRQILEAQIDSLNNTINMLENTITNLLNDDNGIDVADIFAQLDELTGQVATLTTLNENLVSQKETLQGTIANLNNLVREHEERGTADAATIVSLTTQLGQLNGQLSTANSELQSNASTISHLNSEVTRLTNLVNTYQAIANSPQMQWLPWAQPIFTGASNEHGVVTASGQTGNRAGWGAFDGLVGTVGAGETAGFIATQWSAPGTEGWVELRLNYNIRITAIEFVQRSASGDGFVVDANFTGSGGVALGAPFTAPQVNRGTITIPVNNVVTNIVRLNVLSSSGTFIGANAIHITAQRLVNVVSPAGAIAPMSVDIEPMSIVAATGRPMNGRTWTQPHFTSMSNEHGRIAQSGSTNARPGFGAFDGWVGTVGAGEAAGFTATQWTKHATEGWVELRLNYQIRVTAIEFVQRSVNMENNDGWTRDAFFTGSNGIPLGGPFWLDCSTAKAI